MPRIRTFSLFCRERYGLSVGKIPLDVGIACPNRRLGGCVFCLPRSFTPFALRTDDTIPTQIARGKRYLLKGRFTRYFAYFQQETPTVLPLETLGPIITTILADPDCLGLILSSRPDCLANPLLVFLAETVAATGKDCLIELGVQSMHARSLAWLNRNHDFQVVQQTIARIHRYPALLVGAHLILGIPGESREDMAATIATLCALGMDSLKLHHLQVIRGTPLEQLYERGEVPLFSCADYMELLLYLLPRVPAQVMLQRLWSHAHPEVLVAPRWQRLAGTLRQELDDLLEKQDLRQGMLSS